MRTHGSVCPHRQFQFGKVNARGAAEHPSQSLPFDLDTLAWKPKPPPERREATESRRDIAAFTETHGGWIIEGCYAGLLTLPLSLCTKLLFLNPGVDACIENALARPWEPHKYPSRQAQDANLEMLVNWIRQYDTRSDEFSFAAHREVFFAFDGSKAELTSRNAIATFEAGETP